MAGWRFEPVQGRPYLLRCRGQVTPKATSVIYEVYVAEVISGPEPMLVADLLGRRGFGTISGAVAVTPILASAAAPSFGAALLHMGGPGMIYAACLVMAAAGMAIGLWLLGRHRGEG